MTTIYLVQGDTGPQIYIKVTREDTGVPIDVSGGSAAFLVRKKGQATVLFTLPAADGTAANKPLVTNGSGTLAFSPLSMPSTDGTANKPLVTDGSGQLAFSPNVLPSSLGTSGQVLKVNSGATATEWGNSAIPLFKKTLDFATTPAQSTLVTWSSVNSSITYSNIVAVRLTLSDLSSVNSSSYLYIYGLDSGGTRISSGYMGGTYYGYPGGNGQDNNSNNGHVKFPNYGNGPQQTGSSYGQGISAQINFHPWRQGSGDSVSKGGRFFYNMSYQHSSNTWESWEAGSWGSYSSQDAPAEMVGGFEIYGTSGNYNHGYVVIEVLTKG